MESVWKEWDIQLKLVEAIESKCDRVKHVAAHLLFTLTLFPLSQQWWWSPSITPRTIRTHSQHNPVHVSQSPQHGKNREIKLFFWAIYSFILPFNFTKVKKSDKVYCSSTFPKAAAENSIDMIFFSLLLFVCGRSCFETICLFLHLLQNTLNKTWGKLW